MTDLNMIHFRIVIDGRISPRDFFKKTCFLYVTEVNIFILDGYLEDLMKHIIGQIVPIAEPVLWLNLARNSQMSIICNKKRK